jgi:hypothetical protein
MIVLASNISSIFSSEISAIKMASKMRSLTLNFFRLYIARYLPWRFGAKVRGGPSGPPLLHSDLGFYQSTLLQGGA